MKATDKKKIAVKRMSDEDTTKYVDYSKPLNFEQLLKVGNKSIKRKSKKKAA